VGGVNLLIVQDPEGNPAAIPFDNIAHIIAFEGTTRIYLRSIASGHSTTVWYVLTHESVMDIANRLADVVPE
jgi:hypothetical protein